jgi:hypothetical protein
MNFDKIINNLVGLYGQNINMKTIHNYFNKIIPMNKPIFSNKKPLFINNNDLCISFHDGRDIKIYPLAILFERYIIHDKFYKNGKEFDVSITYCPFTGCPIVYEGLWGVSGLLYNNNIILFNLKNKDLMVQIFGVIIYGYNIGHTPRKWPMIIIPFDKIYDDSCKVLQGELNDNNNYLNNSFNEYLKENRINYPIAKYSLKHHQKKIVYVINNFNTIPTQNRNTSIIVPTRKNKEKNININNKNVKIYYDKNINSYILNKNQFVIPMFWFASYALFNDPQIINI